MAFDYATFVTHKNVDGFDAESIKALAAAKSKGSILMMLALVLGQVADRMMVKIQDLALELGRVQSANIAAANNGKTPDKKTENILSSELQAQTQILNMFMQALSGAIKTAGEAQATIARKG